MKKFFLRLTFLIFSILPLFPIETTKKDEKSISMREIDELIKSTEYNKALELLSRYIKDNPEKFDLAQKRISKIISTRQKYNALASELIDILKTDPENNAVIYELTEDLASYEKHPTEESLAFIQQAKQAARFAYFKAKYDDLMTEGTKLAVEGKYDDAINTFKSGFSLYKEDYDEKNYGEEITKPVSDAVTTLRKTTQQFSNALLSLNLAKDSYIAAVKRQDFPVSKSNFDTLKTQFSNAINARNEAQKSGNELAKVLAKLQEDDPMLKESSYVAFLMHFVLGKTSDPDSGIVAAMDAFFNRSIEEMKSETLTTTLSKLDSVKTIKTRGVELSENIKTADGFSNLALGCQRLYGLFENVEGEDVIKIAEKYSDFEKSLDFVPKYLSIYDEAIKNRAELVTLKESSSQSLAIFKEEQETNTGNAAENKSFVAVLKEISSYEKIQLKAESLKSDSNLGAQLEKDRNFISKTNIESQENRTTAGCIIKDESVNFLPYTADIFDFLSETSSLSLSYSTENWIEVSNAYALDSDKTYLKNQTELEEARSVFYGSDFESTRLEIAASIERSKTNPSELDEFESKKQYPAEGLSAIENISKTIGKDISFLKGYLATLESAHSFSQENLNFKQNKTTVESDIKKLLDLIPKIQDFQNLCVSEIQKSTLAKNEADLRYSEALNFLKKDQFNEARSSLQKARTKYNESLGYQESEKLRGESDEKLERLGGDLAKRENELVVRDVRALKNNAKKAYFDGDFERAENYLSQAKSRWSVTNVEDDQEILNLMALVTTALSMKTGRDIPPASPLYPEMSQILNNARLNYETGRKLISKNKNDEAKKVLDEAKEQIHTVQLVFPINKEASLLSLRIDQLIDPKNFNAMFDQRVAAAKINYKNTLTRQSAYMDLLDLYEINPKYPGLKQDIYDIEIAIGIRQKPVDNSAKTRSTNLTKEAQNIFNKANGNENQLRSALAKLDDAIKLNPDNSAAQSLKDKIQTSIGGQAAVVLSSNDEALFQRAINALQKNNIITANALVEQLLQKPVNRRSTKVLDLQKKVQALL